MSKKYIYLALFLFATWFFSMCIPLDTFHHHYILLTLVAGVTTTVLLGAALFNFFPAKTDLEGVEQKQDENFGCYMMAAIGVFFFGYSIFLIYQNSTAVSREIVENGEYTTGYIIDGSSYKTRKVDLTDVTIEFKSVDGKKHTVTHEISAAQFQRYYQNQEVPIVYSKRYPSLVEILSSDEAIARYSKRQIRNIELKDLTNVLSIKGSDEIKAYLNNINQKWVISSSDGNGTFVYSNRFKNIVVKVIVNKSAFYIHSNNEPGLFRNDFIEMGFKPIEADVNKGMKGSYYQNDSFIVNKRMERMRMEQSDASFGPEYHTIVEVMKIK